MVSYRFYILNKDGQSRRSHDADCADDAQALEIALAIEWPEGIEVWQGTRKVGIIKPEVNALRGMPVRSPAIRLRIGANER